MALPIRVWVFALLASAAWPRPAQPSTPAPRIADRYIQRTWGTADGLPQNTVTSILQTRDGYLWLGTFGGLVRFDGQAFTVFDPGNTPGLASARIVTLLEDRNGVIWIGTETGLSKYDRGRFTTYGTRDGLPRSTVAALLDDSRGRLWFATGGALWRFDGRAFERVPLDPSLGAPQAVAQTPDGNIWVGAGEGLARGPADGPLSVVGRGGVASLLVDKAGRLWIGSDVLQHWDGSRMIEIPLPGMRDTRGELMTLAEDREGTLWIGTRADGLYFRREGKETERGAPDSGFVRALAVDRDGDVWVGTEVGGLVRLKPRRVFSYVQPGADQSIAPIVGDGSDGLWIGGNCGGVFHFREGTFETRVPGGCIWALMRDPDDTLWIGPSAGGLERLSGGRITTYTRTDGDLHNAVTAIARDRGGTLWIGTDIGLSRFDEGRFTDVGVEDGLRQRVLTIAPQTDGDLWVGTIAGLFQFAGGRVRHYTSADGLSNDNVRAIHRDSDGVMWIGTYGGGLNRFKDGRFTTYGLKEGLPDTAVSRIIEDPQGNLWMSGNKGIFRVARRQLNDFAEGRIPYLTSVTYGTADGMIIEETNGGSPAGWRTPDGRLWFPTIKGLVGIEPLAAAAKPPPVVVERVMVNGNAMDGVELPALGPGSVDAEFHYTAIDLGAAEKTRFRYRLDNYDGAWIDGGTRRVAYYTRVPPGRYTFEVMATDSDGAWSTTPAHLAVVIVPFWWQRREAIAAGTLLLVGLLVFGVRHVSLRRARARVGELERERAVERERSRIARDLHDDLGSRLAQIALIAEQRSSASADRVSTVAREAMRTMDELVWTVNARNDTVESFAQYAAEFAEEHLTLAGIRYRLQIQPDLEGTRLNADTRRHLYLAFKEAVHNVVKHAGATEVRIGLGVERGVLALEVADNGRGLPDGQLNGTGNGLRNMRERMTAAGGTLAVESEAGTGTRLVFHVPVAAGPATT